MTSSEKPPKTLILTAHYGAGHIKVSEALRAQLANRDVTDITILDFFDMTAPRLNKFVQSVHRQSFQKAPGLYGAFYRGMDSMQPDSWIHKRLEKFGYETLLTFLKKNLPDLIVCTYPTPAGVLSRMKDMGEYRGFLVTVITDYCVHSQWIHPNVDLYLVSHAGVRDDLIDRGVEKERIVITGIPIHPSFFAPLSAKFEECALDPQMPVVLIMAVGYAGHNALNMIRACIDMKIRAQILVVCGRDENLKAEITNACASNEQVHILGFVEAMDELMSQASVMITKAGGITITEALAKRLPLIIYRPTPGQEEDNAAFLVGAGAAMQAHDRRELNEAVRQILAGKEIAHRMKQASSDVLGPNKDGLAAEEILAHYKKQQVR